MKNRIKELDALRGISALIIVLYHYTLWTDLSRSGFKYGLMGVDLFFIISGFVILGTLQNTPYWKAFIINRFSRLYPAYWISVLLVFLALKFTPAELINYSYAGLSGTDVNTDLFFNLTMLQHYFKIPHLDGSYWTLTVELVFYILVLFILMTRKLHKIEPICIVLVCLDVLLFYNYDKGTPNNFVSSVRFWIPLTDFFPLFFTGILVYKIKNEKFSYKRMLLMLGCFLHRSLLNIKCHRVQGF